MAQIRDAFKITRKTFFNPRGWLDWDRLEGQTRVMWDILRGLFTVQKPLREESFTEAMQRLNLTEADIISGISHYNFYAILFTIAGFILFGYAFFILFAYLNIGGFFLSIAASGLFLAQAFKFSFWALQMRKRTLGLTFTDWKNFILGGKDSTS